MTTSLTIYGFGLRGNSAYKSIGKHRFRTKKHQKVNKSSQKTMAYLFGYWRPRVRVPPLRPERAVGFSLLLFLLYVSGETRVQAASKYLVYTFLVRLDELACGEFGVQSPTTSMGSRACLKLQATWKTAALLVQLDTELARWSPPALSSPYILSEKPCANPPATSLHRVSSRPARRLSRTRIRILPRLFSPSPVLLFTPQNTSPHLFPSLSKASPVDRSFSFSSPFWLNLA